MTSTLLTDYFLSFWRQNRSSAGDPYLKGGVWKIFFFLKIHCNLLGAQRPLSSAQSRFCATPRTPGPSF